MNLRPEQRSWPAALLPLVAAMACIIGLLWGTASGMVMLWWRSETFTHAFLVPPMVMWLAWRKRDEVMRLVPRPAYWVLLPIAALAVVWLFGELMAVNALTHLSLVAMLVLTVPAVLGTEVALTLLFPLCFAFFAVPIGEFALPVLMQWTADFTVAALRLSGVPVFREGLRFVIPTGSWSVVEACSGVRYLMASFMVGSLFAYLNYQSTRRRIIFMGVSLLLPILANWVRAYMIVMLGHLSNNVIATGVDHIVYGWVFFGVVIMGLFTIGARWAEPEPAAPGHGEPAQLSNGSAALVGGPVWASAALVALLAAVPSIGLMQLDRAKPTMPSVQLSLPEAGGGAWVSSPPLALAWRPDYKGPVATASRTYTASPYSVGLIAYYYRQQGDQSKLVSSVNFVLRADDFGWNHTSTLNRRIDGPTGMTPTTVREINALGAEQSLKPARDRLKVWLVYWVDGEWTASDLMAKWWTARSRLAGRGDDGAAVLMYALDDEAGGAERALKAFWHDNRGPIEARLRAARDGTN
ncbi:MAG: exosortase A [Rhodoferax sp.]|nr:exosortase A [Rhodoferax sp.]